ncbi:hypothetical protein [Prauserella muralis]|nr:hypothetical protein [Prauserella muralis]
MFQRFAGEAHAVSELRFRERPLCTFGDLPFLARHVVFRHGVSSLWL